MKLTDALTQIADGLTAGGVPTAVDPRDLNPPCGFLKWVGRERDVLCGGQTVTVQLWLVAPGIDVLSATDFIDDMYTLAIDVLTPNGPSTTTSLVLPDGIAYPAEFYPAIFLMTADPPDPTPLLEEYADAD